MPPHIFFGRVFFDTAIRFFAEMARHGVNAVHFVNGAAQIFCQKLFGRFLLGLAGRGKGQGHFFFLLMIPIKRNKGKLIVFQ